MPQLPRIQPQIVQNFPIYDLSGGLNDSANQITLADNEIKDGRNMILSDDGRWVGRGEIVQHGGTIGISSLTGIRGLFTFKYSVDDTILVFASWNGDVYIRNNFGVGGLVNWEPQSQTVATTKDSSFCSRDDIVYLVDKSNTTKKYTYATLTWANLANFPVAGATSSDQPSGITVFKTRLIAWNTINFSRRVYYSDAGAETIGASNYFDVPEPVNACVAFSDDFLLIFTDTRIYRINTFIFSGTTFDPDRVEEISNIGCINYRTIAKVGSYVYFCSPNGVKLTDGVVVQDITQKVKNTISSSLFLSDDSDILSAGSYKQFYIISFDGGGTQESKLLVYDTVRNIWYPLIHKEGTYPIRYFRFLMSTEQTSFVAGTLLLADSIRGQVFHSYYILNSPTLTQDVVGDIDIPTEYTSGQDTDKSIDALTSVRQAQGFQISSSSLISEVEMLMKKNSGTTTALTIRIETDNAGVPSGTLANVNATTSLTAFSDTSYKYRVATFATKFTLSASTTYWLVVQHTTEGAGDSSYHWGSDASSPTYTLGNSARYSSSAWAAETGNDQLFRIHSYIGYDKYIDTKSFPLGDPQKNKKIKKLFTDFDTASGDDVTVMLTNYKTGVSKTFTIDPAVNSGLKFSNASSFKGRQFYLRFKNSTVNENFKLNGFELNHTTLDSLK